jgi:hypothetical protein
VGSLVVTPQGCGKVIEYREQGGFLVFVFICTIYHDHFFYVDSMFVVQLEWTLAEGSFIYL